MEPRFEANSDAINDLPEELREPLLAFLASRSTADLRALIRAVLADFAEEPIDEVYRPDARLLEDMGLDSLAIAELVFFFEDIFGLKITNQDLAHLSTVQELEQFLVAKLAA